MPHLRLTPLLILSLALSGATAAAAAAEPSPPTAETVVWRVDARAFGDDERLTAACLQGIANRRQGRVFLDYGPSLRWLQFDFDKDHGKRGGPVWSRQDATLLQPKYDGICAYWADALATQGLYRFTTVTMPDLLRLLQPELRGAILYGRVDDDLAVAATMAGLSNAVPLTEALYAAWVTDRTNALPVMFDVRTLRPPPGAAPDRRLAMHRWAIDNLLPACSHSGAVSRDRTYDSPEHDTLVDVDLAVCKRWFTFDLSYMSSETRSGGKQDRPDPHWGYDPPDKPQLIAILDALDPWAPVYGWGRPYESALIRRLALQQCVKICGGTGNGSFFRQIPKDSTPARQARPHAEQVAVEDRYYVAFMVNEGDTLKCATSLMNGGSWLQSERGRIPINWGVDPLLLRDTPGLMSYYYRHATTNDYFFSAPSGWGYLAPMNLADNVIPAYGSMVRHGGRLADTRYIDVWWMTELRARGQFFPLLEAMGMRGLTQWSARQEVEFAPDGTPIIHSNYYYPGYDPATFAARLIQQTQDVPPPWFTVVYGGRPHWFYEVARRLPPERFKVVALDELFEAARAARPRVEGRSWAPPKDEPRRMAP